MAGQSKSQAGLMREIVRLRIHADELEASLKPGGNPCGQPLCTEKNPSFQLENPPNPHLAGGKYGIKDLLDLDFLGGILEKFSQATGFSVGLLSHPDQELLLCIGWRDICTKFHRLNPESEKHCIESNKDLTSRKQELKQLNIRPCKSGLVYGATPIVIRGVHLANLITGQILLEDPDLERFRSQARKYGYDENAYLKALSQVPVVPEQEFSSALAFLGEMAVMLAEQGLTKLLIDESMGSVQKSEDRYRELFDSISDFIYTQDRQGRFLSVNKSLVKALGYERDQIIGRLANEFMLPEFRQAFSDEYMNRVISEGKMEGVSIYVNKNGDEVYTEFRSTLVEVPGREPYISGSARDVTEHIRAQRERKKLETQLRQAQKMEAIGTLTGGIAHDFNNILSAVMGYGELALRCAQKGEVNPDSIGKILDAAERAKGLIGKLLTFSRKAETNLKLLDLDSQITYAVDILRGTIPKMVDISTRFSSPHKIIMADASQIEQIILNLGTNAADAMPGGGSLAFETSILDLDRKYAAGHLGAEPGRYALLKVSDSGHGMDIDTLDQAFEPFFTTKEIGKGTGLGLATVFGILKGHGGHITCYSQPGQGTVFNIYLKLHEAEQPAPPPKAPSPKPARGNETILLVDDEQAIRDIGSQILADFGYKTLLAASGEQALSIYKEQSGVIDLVILDVGMPGMGGLACLRELLQLEPSVRVIIASGYSREGQLKETIDQGAKSFLSKPYRLQDLLGIVRRVLDQ